MALKATNKGKRYFSKSGKKTSAKATPEKPRTSAKGIKKAGGMKFPASKLQPFNTSN